MKKLLGLVAVLSFCFFLTSCYTSYKNPEVVRAPANTVDQAWQMVQQYAKEDKFTEDGLSHNDNSQYGYSVRQWEAGTSLSHEQEIKELAGREIWFKSAPNDRFHSYIFSQVLGSPVAWNRIMSASGKSDRFERWGIINDPDCCVPGTGECARKGINNAPASLADTYGWEFCKGDEKLLPAVGNGKWRDPACDNPVIKASDALDSKKRQNACDLAFGTSAGGVGFRKFPNPRFNKSAWESVGGWRAFESRMGKEEIDASIEPPFRVALACASCHAAPDPLNGPSNIQNLAWKNIKGETGNQYINFSAILSSGARPNAIEKQLFIHARAGALDTSAVPNDVVNNPGTINALINIPQRPRSEHIVTRWNRVESCSGANCQTVSYTDTEEKPFSQSWKKSTQKMRVMNILKGGEDSVGADVAVQRVYVNIGMCAEQCWINHLTNLREMDVTQRGFAQTPFDIAQCRQDCGAWRANEDRVFDIFSYLNSRRPTDLKDAISKPTDPAPKKDATLVQFLEGKYGVGSIKAGEGLFRQNCVGCHSSVGDQSNFLAMTTLSGEEGDNAPEDNAGLAGERVRADWMGNDELTAQSEVGTNQCRALHSNHMKGHVWEQFGSETLRSKAAVVTNARGQKLEGGRGYYRNISLLNVWAHAPFMHDNAIGPELCGVPSGPSPWLTTVQGQQLGENKARCEATFDPTVKGRFALFDKSMDELLTPSDQRRKKIALMDEDILVPLSADLGVGRKAKRLSLVIPKGIPTNDFGSFDLKAFAIDMQGALVKYIDAKKSGGSMASFTTYWTNKYPGKAGEELASTSAATFDSLIKGMEGVQQQINAGDKSRMGTYLKYYSNCKTTYENLGHDFGTKLTPGQKASLKAFMATL